jgi:hypothetical protein
MGDNCKNPFWSTKIRFPFNRELVLNEEHKCSVVYVSSDHPDSCQRNDGTSRLKKKVMWTGWAQPSKDNPSRTKKTRRGKAAAEAG